MKKTATLGSMVLKNCKGLARTKVDNGTLKDKSPQKTNNELIQKAIGADKYTNRPLSWKLSPESRSLVEGATLLA